MCGVKDHAYLPTDVSLTSAESTDKTYAVGQSSFNLFMELSMNKNGG